MLLLLGVVLLLATTVVGCWWDVGDRVGVYASPPALSHRIALLVVYVSFLSCGGGLGVVCMTFGRKWTRVGLLVDIGGPALCFRGQRGVLFRELIILLTNNNSASIHDHYY